MNIMVDYYSRHVNSTCHKQNNTKANLKKEEERILDKIILDIILVSSILHQNVPHPKRIAKRYLEGS